MPSTIHQDFFADADKAEECAAAYRACGLEAIVEPRSRCHITLYCVKSWDAQ